MGSEPANCKIQRYKIFPKLGMCVLSDAVELNIKEMNSYVFIIIAGHSCWCRHFLARKEQH